jgi:vanillate O-demethylase ferredoxin subunit
MTAAVGSLQVRVAAKVAEAEGICSFELVAADGGALPAFSAGAHVDVQVPGGPMRPYSLCNDPRETHRYLIAVQREPASRGGSAGMHERVSVGDHLTIGAPRNQFALHEAAPRHLLLAGGIGITPLLAMAERLAAQGAEFALHHATRTHGRTPFIARLAAAPWAQRVTHHVDDGPPAQQLDLDALLASEFASGAHLYVCGPKGMMDAALGRARATGWHEARLHCEFFAADAADTTADRAFEVVQASTGRVIAVAADQSVARALDAAGIFVPTSCEQGVCGTCLTRVIDGVPEHRDLYLTPEEQAAGDQFTPCCSRARSARLVLDL